MLAAAGVCHAFSAKQFSTYHGASGLRNYPSILGIPFFFVYLKISPGVYLAQMELETRATIEVHQPLCFSEVPRFGSLRPPKNLTSRK